MSNLEKFRDGLVGNGFDWALISDTTSLRWLTGFTGSSGSILVSEEKAYFVTDSRYEIQAHEEVLNCEIRIFRSPVRADECIASLASELRIETLGFESSISVTAFEGWKKKLPNVELSPLGGWVTELRMVKSAEEIEKIRQACALTDACFSHVQRLIQVGVSEYDIQLEIEFYLRRNHAELSFEPIVVSGANSARPHGHATEKLLEPGDFLTMDFGGKLDGYCADLTRTVVIHEASDRHIEIYDQVRKALEVSIEMMKPGIAAKDIDLNSRRILDEKNLAQYFGHGLGHGLGMLVHDPGSLSSVSPHKIAVGQVWTVEPGVYIERFGGVRIEDDVVVTETGVEVLTHSTRELLVLG